MPKGAVTISKERCKLCGICVAVCPTRNLDIIGGSLVAYDRCTGCKLCELHCPDFAIYAERLLEESATPGTDAKTKTAPPVEGDEEGGD